MKATRYAPGWIYYAMGTVGLAAAIYGLGVFLGAWEHEPERQLKAMLCGIAGFVGFCCVLLGWHRFEIRDDALLVLSLRYRRRHTWAHLGRPITRTFVRGRSDSLLFDKAGMRGGTGPQEFSHFIVDGRGKTLYTIGPWYPRRREMMREVRRRTREAHAAE